MSPEKGPFSGDMLVFQRVILLNYQPQNSIQVITIMWNIAKDTSEGIGRNQERNWVSNSAYDQK